MRKRESLYLHALLALVRREFEYDHDLSAGAFDAYDELDVCPTDIHRSKDAHERAVSALAPRLRDLAEEATDESERPLLEAGHGADQYAE